MPNNILADYDSTTADNNTDIGGISIAEGMLPSAVNNSIRELTKQLGAMADGTDALTALSVDNLKLDGNTLSSTDTNGNITLDPDGTGGINLSADVDVTGTVTITGTAVATTDTDTTNTGTVTLDFGANQNFVLTLTGNVTLANPTTEQVGQSGFITFIQDATGGRTVSLGTDYETAGAAGITLSATASTTDIVPYVVVASGRILLGTPQLAFA